MGPHREGAQVERVLGCIEQARAAKERFRPTLSVGRDGILVPLRGGVAQEGATATVSVLDRRGKRIWSGYGSSISTRPAACGYVQQLADTIFGAGDAAQQWAKERRHVLKTKADGAARVLKSASAL